MMIACNRAMVEREVGVLWKIESILHGETLDVVGREIAESDCWVSVLGSGFDGGINSLRL